ncbi:formimidoylglutamase [Elizabethkingia sp. JS20170427COW]|uniref:formimidoylglutamase n=1 Tax=Elizabethkingia sp. JS20170427COW TaxID=2583851 RepID=UPI001110470E|nr:formimidoylglutamase [Elizabethkingia sp. JS20170427COW]QCX53379.1 formimidoylglutamase [Elizabethkingia sp. JS20170427COW]
MEWSGRNDGSDELNLRLFQKVKLSQNYQDLQKGNFVLHGFAVDEGVRRNKGRIGAAQAPDLIRKGMANFPIHTAFEIYDFGNISCEDKDLETSQEHLAISVAKGFAQGAKSIVLGGGHELTFAHFSGIRKAFPGKRIGIVNFDAHFDNRIPEDKQASSGTGFWQIAHTDALQSLHIGIQRNSNTSKLFHIAHQLGMQYILADELFYENLSALFRRIDTFLEEIEVLYITICMDVFNASIAPGVSAPAYNGIFADPCFLALYRYLLAQEKLQALDVAEVNPEYDIQDRTARLAAALVNEWLMIK